MSNRSNLSESNNTQDERSIDVSSSEYHLSVVQNLLDSMNTFLNSESPIARAEGEKRLLANSHNPGVCPICLDKFIENDGLNKSKTIIHSNANTDTKKFLVKMLANILVRNPIMHQAISTPPLLIEKLIDVFINETRHLNYRHDSLVLLTELVDHQDTNMDTTFNVLEADIEEIFRFEPQNAMEAQLFSRLASKLLEYRDELVDQISGEKIQRLGQILTSASGDSRAITIYIRLVFNCLFHDPNRLQHVLEPHNFLITPSRRLFIEKQAQDGMDYLMMIIEIYQDDTMILDSFVSFLLSNFQRAVQPLLELCWRWKRESRPLLAPVKFLERVLRKHFALPGPSSNPDDTIPAVLQNVIINEFATSWTELETHHHTAGYIKSMLFVIGSICRDSGSAIRLSESNFFDVCGVAMQYYLATDDIDELHDFLSTLLWFFDNSPAAEERISHNLRDSIALILFNGNLHWIPHTKDVCVQLLTKALKLMENTPTDNEIPEIIQTVAAAMVRYLPNMNQGLESWLLDINFLIQLCAASPEGAEHMISLRDEYETLFEAASMKFPNEESLETKINAFKLVVGVEDEPGPFF